MRLSDLWNKQGTSIQLGSHTNVVRATVILPMEIYDVETYISCHNGRGKKLVHNFVLVNVTVDILKKKVTRWDESNKVHY